MIVFDICPVFLHLRVARRGGDKRTRSVCSWGPCTLGASTTFLSRIKVVSISGSMHRASRCYKSSRAFMTDRLHPRSLTELTFHHVRQRRYPSSLLLLDHTPCHGRTGSVFFITTSLMYYLTLSVLVVSSPVPEPEPAPIDPNIASVISSNLNLACQHGCSASSSAEQLVSCPLPPKPCTMLTDEPLQNKNAALGSAVSPLSVFGGLVLASGVLAAI